MKKIKLDSKVKDNVLTLSISGIIIAVFILLVLNIPAIFQHFKNFISVISPFLWGLLIAYLGKGLALKIETSLPKSWSFNFRRVLASVITIIFVVLCLVIVVVIIFPQLIASISSLTISIQNFLMNPNNYSWISNLLKSNNGIVQSITSNAVAGLGNFLTSLSKNSMSIIEFTTDFISKIANFGIGIIIALFFLIERGKIKQGLIFLASRYLNKKNYELAKEFYNLCVSKFYNYLKGSIIDCVLVGIECFILMSICRLEYASLISVIVGITNIIPFFGPFIGGIPSFLLLLITNPIHALIFAALVILIQQVDGNLIAPKIIGDSVGVPRLWCMFAIIVFGAYFGFFGMIFGVPIFSVIYSYVTVYLTNKDKKTS